MTNCGVQTPISNYRFYKTPLAFKAASVLLILAFKMPKRGILNVNKEEFIITLILNDQFGALSAKNGALVYEIDPWCLGYNRIIIIMYCCADCP